MIYLLSYAAFCIFLAYNNSERIKDGKRIYHALNGSFHIVAAAGAWYFLGWEYAIICLLMTRVVFDLALNYFRGLPLDYVSLNPKSIVDKWEKKVFGMNGYLPKIIYVLIIVMLLIV